MKRFTITADNAETVIPAIGKYLRAMSLESPQEVAIKPHKRKRSDEQNRRLWSIYRVIGDELGYTDDEIHALMVYKHLGMLTKEIAGQTIEYLPSTTKLNTSEMSEYQERIERWAGTMNIRLPYYE